MFKMKYEFYENLKKIIQPYFENNGSHSFDHTQRVYNLAIRIIGTEKANLDIVKTSAILHDVSRLKQDRGECTCHAEDGAKIAREILTNMLFPQNKINDVCYSIQIHRYSKGIIPKTIEACILQDADRLDALGAITIARIFDYGGKKNRPIYNPDLKVQEYFHNSESNTSFNHFYEKILKIKPESFHTKKAQEIARGRYKFVEKFVNRFIKEWNGEI